MGADSIYFDDDEIKTASSWHGGGGSMLYAIASTGTLSRGTRRPSGIETDAEWMAYLAGNLEGEALDAAKEAGKQARKAKGAEKKELLSDKRNLESIAAQASMAAHQKGSSHLSKKKSGASRGSMPPRQHHRIGTSSRSVSSTYIIEHIDSNGRFSGFEYTDKVGKAPWTATTARDRVRELKDAGFKARVVRL